uniref:Ig-like domain-containing protein n=1 Tax=Anabas testudineus TaxID=64144 RepID=A0AAQ6I8C5_ANATE
VVTQILVVINPGYFLRSTSPRSLSRSPGRSSSRSPGRSPARRLDETDEAQLERLYKPVFVMKPSSCKCSEGQTARFDLKVVGRPMPDTYWFHNEVEPLHLRYGQEQWEEGDLYDKEKQQKPQFKKKLASVRMKRFGPAHFECRLTPIGDPTMVVEWLHDGKPLAAANRLRMVNEFGYCSLDYEVAYARDSGVITCRATNKFGVDQTSATLIRLIVLLPEPVRVLEGDIARFRCRVTGYPAPKVNWYLNGQLIRKSKRYRLRYDGIYYLEITEIKSYDSGEVKVVADNNMGSAEHTVKLEIQQKEDFRTHLRRAPDLEDVDGKEKDTMGTKAVLEAKISAQDISSVKWYHDDQLLTPSDRVQMVAKGAKQRLVFNRTYASDEGQYKLVVGRADTSCRFSVQSGAIKKPLHDLVVADSQTAVLQCEVANPSAEGRWLKDGQAVDLNENVVSEADGAIRRLVIIITKATDIGEYTYQVATSKTTATLKVEAVKVKKTLKNLNVVQTQEAVFSLELTHENVRGAQWIKNGVEIQPNDKYEINIEGVVHTLKIKNCTTQDESVYSFKLGKLSANARLNVESRQTLTLQVTKPMKSVEVPETQVATFECEVSHFNVPSIWLKDGVEIEMSEKFRIVVQGKLHQLKIMNTSRDDSAEYTFVCGNDRVSYFFSVTARVVEFTKHLKDLKITEKKRATFECEVSEPNVQVMWMKDGQELEMSDRYNYNYMHRLVLPSVRLSDAGEYTAVAGSSMSKAHLGVEGRDVKISEPASRDITVSSCTTNDEVDGRWMRNGVEIQFSVEERFNYVTIRKLHRLTISETFRGDAGEYTFLAGKNRSTMNLHVRRKTCSDSIFLKI